MKRRTAWWRARARLWWPDRNPLRRSYDRVQAAVIAMLGVAFLIAAPLASMAAEHWATTSSVRTEHAEQASRHQVSAVLESGTPTHVTGRYLRVGGTWEGDWSKVRVRWLAPDGTPHSALLAVPPGSKAGTTVTVWTDKSGRLVPAPLTAAGVTARARIAAILAPAALGLATLCVALLIGAVLNRRRLAAWQADWRVTAPRWTRQQH